MWFASMDRSLFQVPHGFVAVLIAGATNDTSKSRLAACIMIENSKYLQEEYVSEQSAVKCMPEKRILPESDATIPNTQRCVALDSVAIPEKR